MTRQQCSVLRDDVMEMMPDGDDDGMVKGKKEKEREMDPLCKIMHVGFPVGSGMQALEILTIKNVPDKCLPNVPFATGADTVSCRCILDWIVEYCLSVAIA